MKSDPRSVINLKGFPNRALDIYGFRLATATYNVNTISIYRLIELKPVMVSQVDSPKKSSFYYIEKIYELLKDFMKHNF